MATETIAIPPSNYTPRGAHALPSAKFPVASHASSSSPQKQSAETIASGWLDLFNRLLTSEAHDVSSLFIEETYWRDLLCMSWDFHTVHGLQRITDFVKESLPDSRIQSISLDKSAPHKLPDFASFGDLPIVQSYLTIKTSAGRGRGLVRLCQDAHDHDRWKAFTLFTTLQEIEGHEEKVSGRRPTGLNRKADDGGRNWMDEIKAQQNFEGGREPTVLILGAGQGGLTPAARLKQLGIETLVIDRNPRIGDNWRNRYHQLVLHDPVQYDHMPYLNFPPNWPTFTPKDKLADWFEYYVGVLELNVWPSTTVKSSSWDEEKREWTVTLERKQNGQATELREIHPQHIILATGHSGKPYFPTDIEGLSDFKGDRLMHSSEFTQPSQKGSGRRAIVVGSCNSGHDIARDYYDHGYDVTMVQRSSTLVQKSETLQEGMMKGVYDEDSPPVEDSDILVHSNPNAVTKTLHTAATAKLNEVDGPLLKSLQAAGFACDSGPDAAGLMIKYLWRGGGYYIDVGCSQLIADGKIKVKQGQEIKRVLAQGMEMADGDVLQADEIVFATGYQNMRTTAREVFGDEVADRVSDVWGFDHEGETRGMWRRSGHPGFWFFGGNLALCRFYSRLLALQICAIEAGLTKA